MRAVLGIDSSCYTTSCALVAEDMSLLSAHRALLKVDPGERGLRQSEAVFMHVRQLPKILAQTLADQEARIVAVCASDRPVDKDDSYMPVFQAGLSLASSLSAALRVPLYTTSHQRGHLAAAAHGLAELPGEYLALHLSGGTTDLLHVREESIFPLGSSLDLHVGQLVDRIGVAMGLSFPAGPQLEMLAREGRATGRYPMSLKGLDCQLSGAEAQAMRDLESGAISREQIAEEVFDLIARTMLGMISGANLAKGIQTALAFGGVASSSLLREIVDSRIRRRRLGLRVLWGAPALSSDNAVGVALIGADKYRKATQEGT